MKKKPFSILSVLLASLAPLVADEKPAAPALKPLVESIDLKDGDTLVFCGDSITHQCLYTQYVEDFFYTRYPKRHIRFHNAGVGGDRGADALLRFDEDVAAFKPKYVTILLGMNDGKYRDFNKELFDTYQKDMTTLLDRIAALGAIAVPMTPTMFDARSLQLKGDFSEPRNTYYNGVLALYGSWLREQALNRGLGFVDMWSPLNDITLAQRKKDANFSMIPGAVHPGPVGHAVMAVAVINDMVPQHGPVSSIILRVDPVTRRIDSQAAQAVNGKITDMRFPEGQLVSFTFLAESLPWVLPPDAAEGAKLTHLGHRFSNEKVTINNLPPGNYELKIDGQSVGTYTGSQFAHGVELEENEKTPQYQQALKVAMLNKERTDKAVHPLREQWRQRKGKRIDERSIAEHPDDASTPEKKEAFEKWLVQFKKDVEKLNGEVKKYDDQIHKACQPVPRKYELIRVPPANA